MIYNIPFWEVKMNYLACLYQGICLSSGFECFFSLINLVEKILYIM